MKQIILKYNLEAFSLVILIILMVRFLFCPNLSMEHRIISAYMIAAVLHEFEEKRVPGGFYELMAKKFALPAKAACFERAGLCVTLYWTMLLAIPSAFPRPVLLMPLTFLGLFEAFIHTVGIRIHRLHKPYTPGMVTAWVMAAVSVFTIRYLSAEGLTGLRVYLFGAVLFILSFLLLETATIHSFGMTFGDIRRKIQNRDHRS